MTLDTKAIRARLEAARGEWEVSSNIDDYLVLYAGDEWIATFEKHGTDNADAAFIAAARTDIPALLAEVERLSVEAEGCTIEAGEHIGNLEKRLDDARRERDTALAALEAKEAECEGLRGERDEWRTQQDYLVEVRRADLRAVVAKHERVQEAATLDVVDSAHAAMTAQATITRLRELLGEALEIADRQGQRASHSEHYVADLQRAAAIRTEASL